MSSEIAPAGPRALVHATAVALGGATAPFGATTDSAVLLTGDSGAGKSDVALRLIAAGAKLISDDQTELFIDEGRVFADAPKSIGGAMEIRGVGIVQLEKAPASPLVLAVRLEAGVKVPRLPEPAFYALPSRLQTNVKLPLLTFDGADPSTPAKIAAAAAGLLNRTFVAGALPPAGFSSL
jgi:HPr kinase/phosphorylase